MEAPLKILLIEDDEVDRTMVRRALKAAGVSAEFREVSSGDAALRAMRDAAFDCVLLDHGLPDGDGLAVLRAARKAGVTTPIIMLTGQGDEQLAVEMMKAGASDYLSKTRLSRDLLSHSVRHAVGLRNARAELDLATALRAESEERFQRMADSAPVLLWVTDDRGNCTYVNRVWQQFVGKPMDLVLGRGWLEDVFPEDVARIDAECQSAYERQEQFEVEYRLRRADGRYRWISSSAAPRTLSDGTFAGFVGSCTDIDDRKRAADSLRFLAEASAVLSSSLDYRTILTNVARLAVPKIADWCAVDMVEPDGAIRRIVVIHRDPEKLRLARELETRYPPDPANPRGVPAVLKSGKSQLLSEIPDDLIESAVRDAEHGRLIRALGLRSVLIVPLVTGDRVLGALTLVNAETDYHYGPRDLELAEDLARRAAIAVENARLHQALRDAKDAAEAANSAKDQFLAVLSHELRTPLTPVLSTVQAIESDPGLADELRGSLDMIRRNVELEARLIDDLLDLTRIAKGKLELHPETIDAHACLKDALEICNDELRGKRQDLVLDLRAESHHVSADGARLQQVFWNLIKNAIKFTPEGGRITIRSRNEPAGRLRLEFRDTGIGIEPELLPRIFEAFEQGERSITRKFGGLGLGLAISKALVDMLGGTLTADSAGKNHGAVFVVSISAVSAPDVPTEKLGPDHRQANAEALRILLVDDHVDTAKAMRRLLERLGYQVTLAGTVKDGLREAADGTFDLLISDIGLPDGSGLELMRQICATKPIRGVALSGFGLDEDVRKSKDAGFAEHLTKPVNLQKLDSVIRRVASREK